MKSKKEQPSVWLKPNVGRLLLDRQSVLSLAGESAFQGPGNEPQVLGHRPRSRTKLQSWDID